MFSSCSEIFLIFKCVPDLRSGTFQVWQYWIHNSLLWPTYAWKSRVYNLLYLFCTAIFVILHDKSYLDKIIKYLLEHVSSFNGFIRIYFMWPILVSLVNFMIKDLSLLKTRVTLIKSFWSMFLTQRSMSVSEFIYWFLIFISYMHPF